LILAIALHLVINALCRTAQGQLAQRHQVALAKEALDRLLCLLWQVNLAFLQPLEQVIG
jgi:hypothetical protein